MVWVAQVPVGQGELVSRADDAHIQVIAHLGKPELVGGDTGVKPRDVGVARSSVVLGNGV